MDAIIGRYRANMGELDFGLILRHPSGINFDLTPEEMLGLLDFINLYKQTLIALKQESGHYCDTEAQLKRVTLVKEDNQNDRESKSST